MADYKVVDAEKLNADLSGVANAIRTKAETSGGLVFPEGFISAVNGIQKGIIPTEIINITSNNISNQDITYGKTLNVSIPVTHFATGVVNNITAGQAVSVTGIKDDATGEAFEVKGILFYIQPTANSWIYPPNHASSIPACFCLVRDNSRRFGTAMSCGAQSSTASYVREVRFNTSIGGVTNVNNTELLITGNSFSYIARNDMYGLLAASQWRWVAWG